MAEIVQLNAARQIVLGDAELYPQVVEGILPIIGANARLELRRWGAEFLAETFASPSISSQTKENMALLVLQTLKDLLEVPAEDLEVVKAVVQVAASIYGLIFRYIIANPIDIPTWNNMAAVKSNILKRWDTAPAGVRICCIKFVQKVVQVQTPGVVDPRRPDKNEISIALVPRDHPLLQIPRLEPESSGLLDRLLDVFNQESDAIYISATLNCLSALLRSRPPIYNKIISAILNFNPFKLASGSTGSTARLQVKSLEKTTRILLNTMLKRNDDHIMSSRIKAYIDRLERHRIEMFASESASRKRGLPTEPTDGLDPAKRRRLGTDMPRQTEPLPLPLGLISYAQLYTLTDDQALANFGVWQLPQDLVTRVTLAILAHIEAQPLDAAINHVRSRYLTLSKEANAAQKATAGDDEEDYEPDFEPSEDREQILNKADVLPAEGRPQEAALGPFILPRPPPLTPEETDQIGKQSIGRVFSMMNVLEEPSAIKRQKPGLNRLAGSNYDREAWVTVITRLATRASAGLDLDASNDDPKDSAAMVKKGVRATSLSDGIRETLWKFIIEDFRARISIAIAWLNEEWFNDRIQSQLYTSQSQPSRPLKSPPPRHYETWTLRILDGILPYLDAKDKLLLRFLSEIPTISPAVLDRVKGLAKDPERVDLAVKAIHYLILMKPPARDICIDAVEDLWRNFDDARMPAQKLLIKWRPGVLPPPPPPPPEKSAAAIAKKEEKEETPSGQLNGAEQVSEQPKSSGGEHLNGGTPVAAAG